MSPPHAVKAFGGEREEGELLETGNAAKPGAVDDFDSVFGESSPVKRHLNPRKSKDPIKVSSGCWQGTCCGRRSTCRR